MRGNCFLHVCVCGGGGMCVCVGMCVGVDVCGCVCVSVSFFIFTHRSKEKLSGAPDSQLSVIGSFVPAIPWILRSARKTEKECAQSAVDFIRLTHPVAGLVPFVDTYARLLHAALNGRDLKLEVLRVLSHSELGGPAKRQMVLQLQDEAHK